MKRKHWFILTIIFLLHVGLRLVYAMYGYIPSEEGILLYGQRLAYSGLLPFIDYNAWNSLINNYLIGWYQWFIKPTIITQRFFGIGIGIVVFILVIHISRKMGNFKSAFWASLFLTFGSLTYLYYSTIPTSEQTMTLALVLAWAVIAETQPRPPLFFRSVIAFGLAVLAIAIRPQAVPATFFIWLYLGFTYRHELKRFALITSCGIFFLLLIYLPFALSGWDNFLYSIFWPFFAHRILVYQYGVKTLTFPDVLRFIISVFKEYEPLVVVLGSVTIGKCLQVSRNLPKWWRSPRERFIWFSFLSAAGLATTGLLHRPPYSTYVYPAIPILAYVAAVVLENTLEKMNYRRQQIKVFIYSLIGLLLLHHLVTFAHADYMKTSLATIDKTPYTLLREISSNIEQLTTPQSEILSFYIPAAVELDRIIPINLNEGEGSISILSRQESLKYHLTNVEMLKKYISSGKAEAIVTSDITPNFFGITDQDRQSVVETINRHYYIAKTFTNFSQIGNPRVKNLYLYLKR